MVADASDVGLHLGDGPLGWSSEANRDETEREEQASELDHVSMDGFPLRSGRDFIAVQHALRAGVRRPR